MALNPRMLIPVAVVAALAAGGIWIDRSRAAKRSMLSGTFESQPANLSSRVGGRVARVLVKEGDHVTKGQKLVEFDAEDKVQQLEALRLQAAQAEQRAQETRSGNRPQEIARQRAVVAELQASFDRLKNGSLPEDIAQAQAKVQTARARLRLAEQGPRTEDIAQAEANLREAQARLAATQRGPRPEDVAQIDARAASAQANADQATRDADRSARLYREGAVSQSDFESAQTRLRTAQANLREAKNAQEAAHKGGAKEEVQQAQNQVRRLQAALLELKNGSRPEEIEQARADLQSAEAALALVRQGPRTEDIRAAAARLQQAKAQLDLLQAGSRTEEVKQSELAAQASRAQAAATQAQVSESTLVAPADGVIERVLVAEGDLVTAGSAVLSFSNPSDIWLRVYVPEDQLAKVKVGDSAKLAVDGLNGDAEGVVESVATQGEFTPVNLQTPEERGRQSFAVRIRLRSPDPKVKAGMAASVRSVGAWP